MRLAATRTNSAFVRQLGLSLPRSSICCSRDRPWYIDSRIDRKRNGSRKRSSPRRCAATS